MLYDESCVICNLFRTRIKDQNLQDVFVEISINDIKASTGFYDGVRGLVIGFPLFFKQTKHGKKFYKIEDIQEIIVKSALKNENINLSSKHQDLKGILKNGTVQDDP